MNQPTTSIKKNYKPLVTEANVVSNRLIKENYWRLRIEARQIAKQAKPGQFVNLSCIPFESDFSNDATGKVNLSVLLKRPFTIAGPCRLPGTRHSKCVLDIIYQVIGKGTLELTQRKPGEKLQMIGPLGNGWPLDKEINYTHHILVAGGSGIASLAWLAQTLEKSLSGKHRVTLYYGAQSKRYLLSSDELGTRGITVHYSTDDGTRGFHGKVTDLLAKNMKYAGTSGKNAIIYACGPREMLKATFEIARSFGIPSFISWEGRMGCGYGACQTCAIPVTGHRYARVCTDGPIFRGDKIRWAEI